MIPGTMQGAEDNKMNKRGNSGPLAAYNPIGVKNTA